MPNTVNVVLAALLVVFGGLVINLFCIRLYQEKFEGSEGRALPRWVAKWDFSPETMGGFSYWRLFLTSVLGLFLEMLLIRWLSSELSVFAYFKNFVLVACFLGFGLGCYLANRRINLLSMLAPLLTLALICDLPWAALRAVMYHIPNMIGAISQIDIWGVPSMPLNASTLLLTAAAVLLVVPIFGLVALFFVPIGQLVGWYLENATRGLSAYTVNVLGGFLGIGLYTVLCFLWQPPAVWFVAAGMMLAALLWKQSLLRWSSIATLSMCVLLASMAGARDSKIYWSPYQKLSVRAQRENGAPIVYQVGTNDSLFQEVINLSPTFVTSHREAFERFPLKWNHYNMPYNFYHAPASVLLLGAGTGNDAAAALRNGAESVTAVEIDPLIVELGRRLHFEKPYSSPRVHVVINDARSYLQNTHDRFDFIVFSLLDSHTTSSYYSNIRIDNYVYTVEALRSVKRLLKPDGLMVVKFRADKPWISGRLNELLETTFGQQPLQFRSQGNFYATGGRLFICGDQRRIARALRDPQLSNYIALNREFATESAALTTDDWPYFYQHEPGVPASIIIISVTLVLVCWIFLRKTATEIRSLHWHFFFLGAGFLLLETQIVSRMALLFGTTWFVNSVVIGGILILIVAANCLVEWGPAMPEYAAYLGIVASVFVGYTIPIQNLFFDSIWIKGLAATAVLCLPVFFAGIIFIRSFARYGFRSETLGSNLFGALAGGLLESLSMWTGIRSLLILAGLLYLASWFTLSAQESLTAPGSATGRTEGRLATTR